MSKPTFAARPHPKWERDPADPCGFKLIDGRLVPALDDAGRVIVAGYTEAIAERGHATTLKNAPHPIPWPTFKTRRELLAFLAQPVTMPDHEHASA